MAMEAKTYQDSFSSSQLISLHRTRNKDVRKSVYYDEPNEEEKEEIKVEPASPSKDQDKKEHFDKKSSLIRQKSLFGKGKRNQSRMQDAFSDNNSPRNFSKKQHHDPSKTELDDDSKKPKRMITSEDQRVERI